MVSNFMFPKSRSGPEGFLAEIAGNSNSFQMIGLNVVFDSFAFAFLSTHFASVRSLILMSIQVFTFLHQ